MKLSKSFLIKSALASHFRGATFLTSITNDGDLKIDIPQAWRKTYSYLPDNCSADEIANYVVSDWIDNLYCNFLANGTSCGYDDITYIPTFGDSGLNYCYGSGSIMISPAPAEPYSLSWSDCCWVPFTSDYGHKVGGSDWEITGEYYEVLNSAPSFELPPIWMILSTCPGQFIALNPIDADGDKIKCRWASSFEARGASHDSSVWPSISLDEDNCIVHYDGTLDISGKGVKPIALMIEDFDKYGNVKSSTPIQFLAKVWTPEITNLAKIGRMQGHSYKCWPHCYPEIPHDDDEDEETDEFSGLKAPRNLSPVPTSSFDSRFGPVTTNFPTIVEPAEYCEELVGPVFDDAFVPLDGAEFVVKNGHVDLTLAAISQSGIAVYAYEGPFGFTCGAIDQNKPFESKCSWTLSAEQKKETVHQLCVQAVDNAGFQSERRCFIYISEQTPEPCAKDYYGVCAFDEKQNRILSEYYEANEDMTVEMCLSICRSKGFPFSGLQWQCECHCGNKPDNGFEWAWSDKCDDRCSGDQNQNCGGSNAMSVWTTPPEFLDGLCVNDYPQHRRVLNGFSVTGLKDLTIDYCRSICEDYDYFGVENGDSCYCGNDDSKFIPVPINECDKPCAGDSSEICGGSWRLSVYGPNPPIPTNSP